MDIYAIRKRNLTKVIDEKYGGVAANLARALKKQPNVISRIFSDHYEYRRNIGSDFAREIETVVGLQTGWMDVPHGALSERSMGEAVNVSGPLLDVLVKLRRLPDETRTEIENDIISYLKIRLSLYCTKNP